MDMTFTKILYSLFLVFSATFSNFLINVPIDNLTLNDFIGLSGGAVILYAWLILHRYKGSIEFKINAGDKKKRKDDDSSSEE